MKIVEYKCDLCSASSAPSIENWKGIKWHSMKDFQFTSIQNAETHLCEDCLRCLKALLTKEVIQK